MPSLHRSIPVLYRYLKNYSMLRFVVFGVLIGLVAGFGASLFLLALEHARFFFQDILIGNHLPSPRGETLLNESHLVRFRIFLNSIGFSSIPHFLIFLIPAFGGLISGLLVYKLAPEAAGHGTDAYIHSFHKNMGRVRLRVPFVKAIASIMTLSTGGSGGREGPVAQIGSGFGSYIGKIFKLSNKDRRILLLAGAAGGLGAVFRAPLGGAITSIEVLYKEDFETDAIIPCIISSVTAYSVITSIFGHSRIFAFPENLVFGSPFELIFYSLMSVLFMVVGLCYIKVFYKTRNFFKKLKVPNYTKPAIAGLLVGGIGYLVPEALGDGWGYIQLALDGHFAVRALLIIALVKIVTTSLTIGSGGSAGVFGPTLFIGAMLGGAFGTFFQGLFPGVIENPASFILVGMASFFAGVANAPLAALLMVCEMTGGYGLIAPLMLVCILSILLLRKYSIYEEQVFNKFHSPTHINDMTVDVLKEMQVKNIINKEIVKSVYEDTPLQNLSSLAKTHYDQLSFPVLNEANELVGIISNNIIRQSMMEEHAAMLIIAEELMTGVTALRPELNLHEALTMLKTSESESLPVIDPANPKTIICLISSNDVLQAYDEVIKQKLQAVS